MNKKDGLGCGIMALIFYTLTQGTRGFIGGLFALFIAYLLGWI